MSARSRIRKKISAIIGEDDDDCRKYFMPIEKYVLKLWNNITIIPTVSSTEAYLQYYNESSLHCYMEHIYNIILIIVTKQPKLLQIAFLHR